MVQSAALRLYRALRHTIPADARGLVGLAAAQIRWELLELANKHRGPGSYAANHETKCQRIDGELRAKVDDAPRPILPRPKTPGLSGIYECRLSRRMGRGGTDEPGRRPQYRPLLNGPRIGSTDCLDFHVRRGRTATQTGSSAGSAASTSPPSSCTTGGASGAVSRGGSASESGSDDFGDGSREFVPATAGFGVDKSSTPLAAAAPLLASTMNGDPHPRHWQVLPTNFACIENARLHAGHFLASMPCTTHSTAVGISACAESLSGPSSALARSAGTRNVLRHSRQRIALPRMAGVA